MVKIRADELLKKDLPKIEYWIEGIIPKSALVYCYGPAGSFKTNFMIYSVINSAMENKIFEFETEKFKTLWIDGENREIGMKDKVSKLSKGLDTEDEHLENIEIITAEPFNILNSKYIEKLRNDIQEFGANVVVIDSIAKFFPGNERDEKDVRMIYTMLSPLITELGVTIILIHHTRKHNFNNGKRSMEDISGSREFTAMADSMILLENIKTNLFMLKQTKNRYSAKVYSENFEVDGDDDKIQVIYNGKAADNYAGKALLCETEVRNWIETEKIEKFTRQELLDIMKIEGYKTSSVDAAIKILKKDNIISGYGEYKVNDKKE